MSDGFVCPRCGDELEENADESRSCPGCGWAPLLPAHPEGASG